VRSCARILVCFGSQSGGCASVSRLKQMQSGDRGTRTVRFVRLALNVVMQNNGDLVDIILLYNMQHTHGFCQSRSCTPHYAVSYSAMAIKAACNLNCRKLDGRQV
jgi:hypothetical protein